MRLNSIKLSGFKSFAEPTHFQLPGQLVGVVGPNGCGKSNIMDAVRWVIDNGGWQPSCPKCRVRTGTLLALAPS